MLASKQPAMMNGRVRSAIDSSFSPSPREIVAVYSARCLDRTHTNALAAIAIPPKSSDMKMAGILGAFDFLSIPRLGLVRWAD